jgi:hypothetical protein
MTDKPEIETLAEDSQPEPWYRSLTDPRTEGRSAEVAWFVTLEARFWKEMYAKSFIKAFDALDGGEEFLAEAARDFLEAKVRAFLDENEELWRDGPLERKQIVDWMAFDAEAQRRSAISRQFPEFAEGAKAHRADVPLDECPYEIGDPRRGHWESGWLETVFLDDLN